MAATCDALEDVPAQIRRIFSHEVRMGSLDDASRSQLLQASTAHGVKGLQSHAASSCDQQH